MDLTFMYTPEYKSIRQNLEILWKYDKPMTKEMLRILMLHRGFRQLGEKKGYERLEPTQKQLVIAWEYIKRLAIKDNYIVGNKTISEKPTTVEKPIKPISFIWIKSYKYRRKNKWIFVKGHKRKKRQT